MLAVLLLAATAHAEGRSKPSEPRTFQDAMGRSSGTASTSGNVTTFRDAMGRLTGTAERMPDGPVSNTATPSGG